jgi:hypothetical protein
MIAGINYPWTVFEGKPNYGCDFGRNKWGSHAGVTAHRDEVRADFAVMATMGVEVARWSPTAAAGSSGPAAASSPDSRRASRTT